MIDTEDEAKGWLRTGLGVSRETMARLDEFRLALLAEAQQQNLIAPSTFDHIWARHIADSAQLLRWAGEIGRGPWLDIGTGAGFPGLVITLMTGRPVTMVEPRARRAEFLRRMVGHFGLEPRARVEQCKIDRLQPFAAGCISARAVAPLATILDLSLPFSTKNTVWLLPKGKNALAELESLPEKWHGLFHVEQSLTDPGSKILIGSLARV